VIPVTEPGTDAADAAAVPPPAVLACAARALQVEAAHYAPCPGRGRPATAAARVEQAGAALGNGAYRVP